MPDSTKILVILPGWGGTKENWEEFVEIAEQDVRVICLELPCFGEVPCPDEVWGVEDYADYVKNGLKRIKDSDSRIVLLGHSFGGQVAAYCVAKHPDLVDKLILSGAAVFRPRKKLKRVLFGAIAKTGKAFFSLPVMEKYDELAKKVLYKLIHSPDYLGAGGIKREIFKKVVRQDISILLRDIGAPTLVVWGSKDRYVPLRQGKKITASIPGAKLSIVRGGKHGLHLQNPRRLYDRIKNFIIS